MLASATAVALILSIESVLKGVPGNAFTCTIPKRAGIGMRVVTSRRGFITISLAEREYQNVSDNQYEYIPETADFIEIYCHIKAAALGVIVVNHGLHQREKNDDVKEHENFV
jgi:hypothetical protein